jgi:transcription antitermination factor NusG
VLAFSTIEPPDQREFPPPWIVRAGLAPPTASHQEERWYAAYTCANHEKRVAAQLRARSVEHVLPFYSSLRRWKDRRVVVDMPLFPCYVFVRLALCQRLRVLQIPSVVRLVGFGGQPHALADAEVALLRGSLTGAARFAPHPYLRAGSRVRIARGPLRGVEGILVRKKSQFRVVLSIDVIACSASVEVDSADLERIF